MKPKRILADNSGLSLIELLLATMILAIITVPLLHSFITSANVARKSRDLGDATLCAQNVAESVNALLVKELALRMGQGGQLMGADIENPSSDVDFPANAEGLEDYKNGASYSFELYGIESGRNSYDALVTLDAQAYSDVNAVEVTQYTPMDAVFSQPGGQYENPDSLTYDDFAGRASMLSGQVYSPDYFFSPTRRTIDITLAESGGVLTAVTTFQYSCSFTYSVVITGADGRTVTETNVEELTSTYSYEFYREKLTEGGARSLRSIYFFYYPNYSAAGTYNDFITIHNENDVEFSLFLIKQKALDYSGTPVNGVYPTMASDRISANDASYTADVALMESSGVSSPVAKLYSNINQDISGIASQLTMNRQVRFRAFRGRHWYVDGVIENKLVATATENRFFALTVTLYDRNALSGRAEAAEPPGSDSVVYALTASKLD